MTAVIIAIVAGVIAGAIVAALMWGVVYRKRGEAQLEEARRSSDRIVADANKQAEARLKEADKLGFASAWMPRRSGQARTRAPEGAPAAIREIANLGDLLARFDVTPGRAAAQRRAAPR